MYHCLCCGYRTLPEQPPGTYYICAVCFWEDDDVQAADPDYAGGANRMSLRDARESFQQIGAKAERNREWVRPPTELEQPGIRPLETHPAIDRWLRTQRPGGGHLNALVVELMEELTYWDTVVAITLLPLLEGIPVTPSVDITAGLAAFTQRLDTIADDQPEPSENASPNPSQHYWDRVVQLLDQPNDAEGRFRQFRTYLEVLNGAWVARPT